MIQYIILALMIFGLGGCSLLNSSDDFPAPAPAPVVITDSDNDGVLDDQDQCPNTPLDDMVDSTGCSLFYQMEVNYRCIPNESDDCLADLPYLDWPLPEPNKAKTFRVNELTGLDISTIGTISNDLESILKENGYERFSYYHIPLGIAMVTELERITSDGAPHPERWKFGDLKLTTEYFDFTTFLKRFVGVDSGLYRVLVFIISYDRLNIEFKQSEQSTQFIQNLPKKGALMLPREFAPLKFEDTMKLSLVIYELELKQTKTEAEFIVSGLQIRDHLLKTGLILKGED
jgi:hypothetical protein